MGSEIGGKELIRIIVDKFFTSDITNAIINIMLPCIISIRCTYFKDTASWWVYTIILCILIILFNIVSVICKNKKNAQIKMLTIVHKCYNEQSSINNKFANNIFRLNNNINDYLKNRIPITKKSLDKIADFQTFSFAVCESIQGMLKNEFGIDIQCEVTLMKKERDIIKMIAYANNNNQVPSSYKKEFNLSASGICFVRIFNDLDGEILCLPTKKSVNENFEKLKGSVKREDEICQYIGIPIKTNRNEIELLLQIDVSKEKIFGKTEEELKSFAKNILYPYAMLLHKSYERDLVFNQYYDMIITMLTTK